MASAQSDSFTEFRKRPRCQFLESRRANVLMFFVMFRNVRFFLALLEHYAVVVARGGACQAMPVLAYQFLSIHI